VELLNEGRSQASLSTVGTSEDSKLE